MILWSLRSGKLLVLGLYKEGDLHLKKDMCPFDYTA